MDDKNLAPYYKSIYSPETVELENIALLLSSENIDVASCLKIIANSCKELKADFNNYLLDSYGSLEFSKERLPFIDIGNMAHFIIWKYKLQETHFFDIIFTNAEILLQRGDENLIVVGFFEGIQNVGGWHDVDYYKGFDQWLKPESKKAWDELIKFWEGGEEE